jgi:serine/threonine protein kinase
MDARNHRPKADPCINDIHSLAQSLINSWQELCTLYLPVTTSGAAWSYSRTSTPRDPAQGWKLHLSAHVLTACEVLRKVAPFLRRRGVLFKAPSSLQQVSRINAGLHYGYSQVGKIITAYPRSDREALYLARRLHKLTLGMKAPVVPFDLSFRAGSCVYYRYGAYSPIDIENPDGTRTPAIRDPQGNLVPDCRESITAKPDWVIDPLIDKRRRSEPGPVDSPLSTSFRAFRALSKRGKGGVYQAIDLSADPPRLCILKEGRSCGEVGWDGGDGYTRLKNEEEALYDLQASGVNVPRLYSSFEVENNYYLAIEFIEGDSLQALLNRRRRRLTISQVLRFGIQLSLLVSQIHAAGWMWRDCKPANLIVTKEGELRPLDFEGACPFDKTAPLLWSTPDFAPPESQVSSLERPKHCEDVYAIGAIIYFLLTARIFAHSGPLTIKELRRNVPPALCDIISKLLAADPQKRPTAQSAAQEFMAALSLLECQRRSPLPQSGILSSDRISEDSHCITLAHRARSANLESERRLTITGSAIRNGKAAKRSLHASSNKVNACSL